MTDINHARFTIDGSPSEDPVTGDAGYAATHGQTLDCTLEQTPSEALSVRYDVFDPTDSTSPLASYQADNLTWVASGLASQDLTNPNGTAQIIMPATDTQSWLIRCTATMDNGADVYERLVYLEAATVPALRKTFPAESTRCRARSWSDDLNMMVDAIAGVGTAFGSAGTYQSAWVTDAGGATIDVAAGTGYLRTTASVTGTLAAISWSALSGSAIPANVTRYVGVEYNAGSPQAVVRTTNTFNGLNDFLLATVYNESGTLHILEHEQATQDGLHGCYARFFGNFPISRDERTGGLIVGDTGALNVTLSAGNLYDGLSVFAIAAIDTSAAGRFDYYYRAPLPNWTKVAAQAAYSSTNYDDGSGALQPLTVGNYGITWWYLESDGHLVGLYGWGDYASLSAAEDATPPSSVPDRITAHGILVGRTIVLQGAAAATEVESVWDADFGMTAVTDHNSLGGLQGGAAAEYYHLTNAHHTDLTDGGNCTIHAHTLDLCYDSGGAGLGRAITVDSGAVSLTGTDTVARMFEVIQTPTAGIGGAETIVSLEAQGTNWPAGSRVLQLLSNDNDAYLLVGNDGAVDVFGVSRGGHVAMAGNLELTGGGTISTTAAGDLTIDVDTTGDVVYSATSTVSAVNYAYASGNHWDIQSKPAIGAASTAIILNLKGNDATAAGTRWAAGSRVLNLVSEDVDCLNLAVNNGVADHLTVNWIGDLWTDGIAEFDSRVYLDDTLYLHPTAVAAATYTVDSGTPDDLVLLVSYSSTAACAITIPTAAITTRAGRLIVVKDSGRSCSVNNITIETAGAETIDGQPNAVLNIDGAVVWLISDGTNLHVI